MPHLIDSDWVADWLKGRPDAIQLLSSLGRGALAISLITFGEIWEGIYFSQNAAGHEKVFRQFLRSVEVVSLTRPIQRRFARIRGELRQRGQLIGDADLLIAATAIHHRLILITRNVRRFERISDLAMYLPNS
ncbi:MAG: type II toxin-antitoxin system VapC family toxin [Chloroflexota bacterium]